MCLFIYSGLWGLNKDGKFFICKKTNYLFFSNGNNSSVDVQKMILLDLQYIQEGELKELKNMESKSNSAQQKRLLTLFQNDLLPGSLGRIFASKLYRDISKPTYVSFNEKVFGYLIIFVVDLSMLFYIFLFALELSKNRQEALLYSFLMWLFIEIFLVGSIVVFILHFSIPLLIMKDVLKINAKLLKSEQDFAARLNSDGENQNHSNFNAAEHLFISTRIAKKFQHLPISNAILKFQTPWPSQSYHKVVDASESFSKAISESASSLAEYIFVILNILVNIPTNFQDTLLQFISTTIFDGLIVVCIQLYDISPIVAMIPFVIVFIILYFMYRKLAQINFTASASASTSASIEKQNLSNHNDSLELLHQENSNSDDSSNSQKSIGTSMCIYLIFNT
jgi:hypothetical protein